MNQFVSNIANQKTTTTNGMPARISTANANVDLYYAIGASRGKDITDKFIAAMEEDSDLAVRILLNARDVLEGKGERQTFKNLLNAMEVHYPEELQKIIHKIPELGRWDDGFCFKTSKFKKMYFALIKNEIQSNPDSLVFKWLPRIKNYLKGKDKETAVLTDQQKRRINLVNDLVKFLGLSKQQYRKLCSDNTKVVEQQMCAKQWNEINFSHVPSIASARYKKAFARNTPMYAEYIEALKSGKEGVKINAKAIFPHQVLGNARMICNSNNKTELDAMAMQWEALPDYIGNAKIIPLIDVSSSMQCPVGRNQKEQCIDVAVALGLYCADKNTGDFKDTFITFDYNPKLVKVEGNIVKKAMQTYTSNWGGSTNFEKAIKLILNHAIKFSVKSEDMPEILLVLSDMQFDQAGSYDVGAFKLIKKLYKDAGYKMPKIVFWNLNSYDNVPVSAGKDAVALVSGFSTNLLKAVLANDLEDFTPFNIMLRDVMKDRYNWNI